jgi:amino acid adenylation domain-containing protein
MSNPSSPTSHPPSAGDRLADRQRLQALLEKGPAVLSPNQLSFWAWEQLEPGNPALILNTEWRFRHLSQAGITRLHAALQALFDRHEALHTRLVRQAGETQPQPQPQPSGSPLDFRLQACGQSDLELLLQTAYRTPFQLAEEAPFRCRLFTYPQGAHLLIQIHHVAADAWSIHILREEMVALLRGQALAPLKLTFSSYARWLQAWLQGGQAQAMLAAWKTELASPRLDFRLSPPPAQPVARWKSCGLHLNAEITAALRHRSGQARCSLNAVILAAYGRALQRFSGRDDLVVAVPGACRQRTGFRHLVGPLFSLLPIRLRGMGQDFDSFLASTSAALESALERQDLPFLALVEELRPRRRAQEFPFTGAALSVLPYGHPEWTRLETPDMQAEHLLQEFSLGPFEVVLNLLDEGQQLRAWLQYQPERLDPQALERLSQLLWQALEEAAFPERHPIQVVKADPGLRLEQRFQQRVEQHPGRTAVVDQRPYSYRELDRWSTALARQLWQARLQGPVGLLAPPSVYSLVGWLALLKAGLTVLPLDPSTPPGRRQSVLADSGCQRVVTVGDIQDLAGAVGDPAQDQPLQLPAGEQAEAAYLLYTSGSQGSPQGVRGGHQAIVQRCQALAQLYPWEPEERVLLRTSLAFIDGLTEWFSALDGGATLIAYAGPEQPDPEHFLDFCCRHQIQRLTLVPSWLGALLRSSRPWPDSLRLCISSGEPLRPDLARAFFLRCRAILLNLYGSTECAGDVSWFDTRWLDPGAAEVPLGVPLGQAQLWVGDDFGHPLPEGKEGEIWVAGPPLALGYWNRRQLEATRFLPAEGQLPRRLRTGDRGRWSSGLLECRGRIDRQAKVRGWRVELQEVEACLESFPGVGQSLARLDPQGSAIWAWVEAPQDLEHAQLWRHLQQQLPAAALPARLYRVERLPRLDSGKVELEALEGQLLGRSTAPAEQAAMSLLVRLWEEVLGISGIAAHDDFFQLGGHSLKALELAERLSRELGRTVSASALVDHPTVALLTRYLQQPRPSAVVTLKPGQEDARPLLVLIPGAWGGTLGLRRLAERLPDGQPVVGLEYEATDPHDRQSLESLAERFAHDLRDYQPQGPYRLCGYSLGGLLATALLPELGRQVDHLILLDAYGPGPAGGGQRNSWANRLHELWTHAQILSRSRPRDLLERLSKLPQRWSRTPSPQLELVQEFLQRRQVQAEFAGRVSLIRLTHQPDWMTDPLLGWGQLFPQLEVRELVGLHGPLVLEEPVVSAAAHLLGELLEEGGLQDGAVASVSP